MSSNTKLDRILRKLFQGKTLERNTAIKIDVGDLTWLCTEAIKVLKEDDILLILKAPITVIGDLHGQFYDLLQYLDKSGKPPNSKILFMGDYVDRGYNSIETFSLLLALKVKYPESIWLLRGNHETKEISRLYGFYTECSSRYNQALWMKFTEVFRYLPLAAVISDRIFCVHGGLSPLLRDLEQISSLKRPLDIPDSGLLCDLLWSDPSNEHTGYRESERGTSFTFGDDVVDSFLEKNDFDLVCRAHQVVQQGFEFPFLQFNKQTLLTVFSAPDYCEEFGNRGAMLKVDEGLKCTFEFVDPPKVAIKRVRDRPMTPGYY
ncbi:Serine/threonine-protein phosphatase PP1-2 [Tritrichomonas foetus]|uniref:Serine/threonine-protein phosphatase n=1 Tax=Tritrichomonas foetus TaxID=1144522 RepID=A0A1J4KBS3_9EUKA|nr:Serine/threonine-protein phosphatase PP1-2 [Tritrichomonas foetus]|eukprot:OHT06917.1 Serine/threonine-protein phosphatase PP1-2 [Tritrichomonas foetus]